MTASVVPVDPTSVEDRARQSRGQSSQFIHRMAADLLGTKTPSGKTVLDVGCGQGDFFAHLQPLGVRYAGADVLRYEHFPAGADFYAIDLSTGRIPCPDHSFAIVAAVETIEHVENPRAFLRELVRLCQPGGWILVTTPNQLSFLSKMTLVLKNEFNAFRANSYPAHLTALLEVDLRRIAAECGLTDVQIQYTKQGRIPGLARSFPRWLSRLAPRLFSDNVALIGRTAS
ncbi:MAG: class I SAM-dependent methyltransferase [Gemmataceae bacterium]